MAWQFESAESLRSHSRALGVDLGLSPELDPRAHPALWPPSLRSAGLLLGLVGPLSVLGLARELGAAMLAAASPAEAYLLGLDSAAAGWPREVVALVDSEVAGFDAAPELEAAFWCGFAGLS